MCRGTRVCRGSPVSRGTRVSRGQPGQQGYPGGAGVPGSAGPGQPGYPGPQGPQGYQNQQGRPGQPGDQGRSKARSLGREHPRSRPTLPALPVVAGLAVCALALLNAAVGFIESSTLTANGNTVTPMGPVYAVAGWVPALLILSGLTAAATRLKGVSVPTLWAVSAAAAVTGGVGALFFLVARQGVDSGLGFVLRTNAASVESHVSAGLVLTVLFGLLQMAVALLGLMLTQSPRLAGLTGSATRSGPGAPPQEGPAAGRSGRPVGPWGPAENGFQGRPPAPSPAPGHPGDQPQGPSQPHAPGHDVGPGGSQYERPNPTYQAGAPYGAQGGPSAGGPPQPPGGRPYGPAAARRPTPDVTPRPRPVSRRCSSRRPARRSTTRSPPRRTTTRSQDGTFAPG